MEWNELLIRYGEISLKGRNRNVFVKKLRNNIKDALSDLKTVIIKPERDRMFLFAEDKSDMEEAIARLPHIFGIQSFSPVAKCEATLEAIKEKALEIIGANETAGKTFKVEVRRTDKRFPLVTNELQLEIGSHVLRSFPDLIVQMKKPDIVLLIDIRIEGAFLTAKVYEGAGGMPVGSNGHSILMLSGGIDSPVAGYLMMKRGVSIDAIHFASPPFTSDLAKKKVMDLAEKLSSFGAAVRLHIIPFTEIQQAIVSQVPDNVSMTTTRRLMLQIADKVREEEGALAIVTGESLGQVASQTLESLTAINAVTSSPILRPLIATDKLDIIDIAQKIGTYDISIRPYEDCCTIFSPSNPKTKPKLEKVAYYESFTDFEPMIEEAIEKRLIVELPLQQKDDFEDLL
ncbi:MULTISPECIES: tRNA uracil 4-sulfurtransferase ThiI [Sporosarcina]|uniref:Probable tRNA sulfurtransferase n=1 Tax=Sporosarcina psychrophila TaxID=1476 RepID=A0ABV2KFI3_SPOPS|nr:MULTISPECIES: tRNA uracil 4-sulfurtransferase ThiI [Sporosarcina]AMQ05786.1 tRNA sulfurtransferase ThiI [Sporosarcina psychrophila]QNK89711.1 tRNA 4-thiouridine(8) synthase ThiI [Sporosarcina sp. resist]